jgi:hypothetical protein
MIRWRLLASIIPSAMALTASQQMVGERDYRGALDKLQSLAAVDLWCAHEVFLLHP